MPFALSLGQTEQMRTIQLRLGWEHVATMESWLLVIDPRRAFRGRVPQPGTRTATAAAGWAWARASRLLGRLGSSPRRITWRTIDTFGPEHDVLWSSVRSQYGAAVVRDASYLNWKYVAQPGQHFRRVETRDNGQVSGVCVWTVHEPDDTHAYRRGWIIDAVVSHGDRDAVAALLRAVAEDAAGQRVDVLEFDIWARAMVPHLRRSGFIRGAKTRLLLIAAGGLDARAAAALRSPDAWYATRGDSDGDHPWWTREGRQP